MGKAENMTLKEMRKDLKQPISVSEKSFFNLFTNRQPLPVCITMPPPDSKIQVEGSYHFELPSMFFPSQISKPVRLHHGLF